MNSLHRLLNCEIGVLDCRVITIDHRTRVHCIHMYHLFCNALVHLIYSGVSGQCSYTISAVEQYVGESLCLKLLPQLSSHLNETATHLEKSLLIFPL